MFFSVIIPVYNLQNYIKKAVNSVLYQSFRDFEIILINDGSIDNSPSICDDFSKVDERVKVVHKKNGGASDARNNGIKKARGKYILFLDGDDYWDDKDALYKIFKHFTFNKDVDLLLFYWKNFNLKTNRIRVYNDKYDVILNEGYSKRAIIKMLFDKNIFPSSSVLTVSRRDFIIENKIYFVDNIKAEDIDWVLQVIINVKKINVINLDFYVVQLNREGSVTYTADIKSIESIIFILDKWVLYFLRSKEKESKSYLSHLAFHYCTCFITFATLTKKEKKMVLTKLKDYLFLFEYVNLGRASLIKIIIKYMGIDIGSRIIWLLYQIRIHTR